MFTAQYELNPSLSVCLSVSLSLYIVEKRDGDIERGIHDIYREKKYRGVYMYIGEERYRQVEKGSDRTAK